MDFSIEHVRREALASQREHDAAMPAMRELVDRLFTGERSSRRNFLRIGGMTIAGVTSAAVFAACGSDDDDQSAADAVDDAAAAEGTGAPGDIAILRTASSLELLAFDVYQRLIDGGFLTTAAVLEAAKLFQAQHQEHAALFDGATKELGGEPFAKANPVLGQQLEPAIAAVKDQAAAVRLALDVENAAAATYFGAAGAFDDVNLNRAAMSVGGVEARHAAVLAGVLGQPQVPRAFQVADGAVAAGTGV